LSSLYIFSTSSWTNIWFPSIFFKSVASFLIL
jgi:hypothetical protein